MTVDEQKQQWRKRALAAFFFGEPIANLDRDGLLAVIGCLYESKLIDEERHASERETWTVITKASDARLK